MTNRTLTAVEGLTVGHWTAPQARTGCTVVVCPAEGCVASGLALGPAPGSRESALLEPEKPLRVVHAVLLTGGSAFGLEAAGGVMRFLEEQGRGVETRAGRVPIVPAAVIYDLDSGSASVRPDASSGYAAAAAARPAPVEMGAVGVGTGARVGRYAGVARSAPGGLGSASLELAGAVVAALAVSNAVGDIVDPADGSQVAGPGRSLLEVAEALASGGGDGPALGGNTTLVVVATDAPLAKAEARLLAQSAHIGVARVTRPSHTAFDGDTTFVLTTGRGPSLPLVALSVAVQEVVACAILAGVRASRGADR